MKILGNLFTIKISGFWKVYEILFNYLLHLKMNKNKNQRMMNNLRDLLINENNKIQAKIIYY